jgi:hypothetical protein
MRTCRTTVWSVLSVALVMLTLTLGLPASPASATVTVTSHFIYTAPGGTFFVAAINNDATNGEGNALLFVTPNYSAGGVCGCVAQTIPFGVIYNLFGGAQWAIANLDENTDIAAGSTYNILVVQKSSGSAFVQTATTANTLGGATYIDSPKTNGNPNAKLLITENLDPGSANEFVSDHPVGAYYNTTIKKWGILNEDGASMAVGAHFNVMVGTKASNGGTEVVEKAKKNNSAGSFVLINSPETVGNPNAAVFVTENSDPGGTGSNFDTSTTGVEYFQSPTDNWAVFQEDSSAMSLGYTFNVLSFSS